MCVFTFLAVLHFQSVLLDVTGVSVSTRYVLKLSLSGSETCSYWTITVNGIWWPIRSSQRQSLSIKYISVYCFFSGWINFHVKGANFSILALIHHWDLLSTDQFYWPLRESATGFTSYWLSNLKAHVCPLQCTFKVKMEKKYEQPKPHVYK